MPPILACSRAAPSPFTSPLTRPRRSASTPIALAGMGDWDGSGQLLSWELQLVRWLEPSGYDVTYSTDVDTDGNAAELLNHKAFFSAGHDEFWSPAMYSAAQAARDAGINLAFFGANDIYWQVRYEASASGIARRVMVCYKSGSLDPVKDSTAT